MLKPPVKRWYYVPVLLPLYLVALLPFPVLYLLSDGLRLLVFNLFGYRKEVVDQNLRKSFPEKNEAWIKKTTKGFYTNLFDVIVEILKLALVSRKSLEKRVTFKNIELFTRLKEEGRNCILVGGHNGNWELCGHALQLKGFQIAVLYHPLTNACFEWYMYSQRTRFGVEPVPMQQVLRAMLRKEHNTVIYGFVADQTPSSENCHWMEFLNQDTPVFLGTEKLAKRFNLPIIFGAVYRVKRGYYHVEFEMLEVEPAHTPDFEITERHTRALEQQIRTQPEAWLWSHRRWKHKRKA